MNWRAQTIAGGTASEFRAGHRAWAAKIAARLPGSLQSRILQGWDDRYGIRIDATNGSSVARANKFAAETVRDFGDARAGLAYDENAISAHAENYAGMCARMDSRERRSYFAHGIGVEPPCWKKVSDAGACARLDDPYWWRRQLRKVWTRGAEDAMRRSGVIRKGRAPYASDEAVRHREARQRRTFEWLKSRVMVNGEGEQLDLIALHETSLANPALRRGEFMCRMRGFEEIARDLGHEAQFWTLTAPSAFHAQLSGGGINPKFKRQTVRDAQAWLRKMWARARAKLARLSISFYGFRVAEPHHDGTPHWHMVLFVAASAIDALQRVLHGVWLSEFADEPGAAEHRSKCKRIDPEQGSATGYVAKYVSKNIDGAGAIGDAISDETGGRVGDSVARVAAWASCHGIRQFQQLGGPPVGLWRECRRVRERVEADQLELARAAADRGDWRAFIVSLGGIDRAKKRVRCIAEKYSRSCEVTPETAHEFPAAWIDKAEPRTRDSCGREIAAVTRYGETPPARPVGVVALGLLGRWASMRTRRHRWRIERKNNGHHRRSYEGQAASGIKAALSLAPVPQGVGTHRVGSGSVPIDSFSDLGPVAITVRGPDLNAGASDPGSSRDVGEGDGPNRRKSLVVHYGGKVAGPCPFIPDPALAWIATVPYRPLKRAGPS